MLPSHDLGELPGEWRSVHGTPDGAELEHELARELAPEHVLVDISVQAVAVRRHLNDVIFWLPLTSEWALIHLTYRQETDPRWPLPTVVKGWTDLVDELR